MTLGHEGVGTVAGLGSGATGVAEGDEVAVYGPWGCGLCRACAEGKENCCPHAAGLGIMPPGLGSPGALAEYMVVDSPRHLVPLNGLDPVQAAPAHRRRADAVPRDPRVPAQARARAARRW